MHPEIGNCILCMCPPSQWETPLRCNVVSHWLDSYTKWSLTLGFILRLFIDNTGVFRQDVNETKSMTKQEISSTPGNPTKSYTLTYWAWDKMATIFQMIYWNVFPWMKMLSISIKISMKFVPEGLINNIPALVQIMAWRRPGDKPLSELMMISLLMQICVIRPPWVSHIVWLHN